MNKQEQEGDACGDKAADDHESTPIKTIHNGTSNRNQKERWRGTAQNHQTRSQATICQLQCQTQYRYTVEPIARRRDKLGSPQTPKAAVVAEQCHVSDVSSQR